MSADLKTFRKWQELGRCIRKGEKAGFYAVRPDGSEDVALFDIEQTEEASGAEDIEGWNIVAKEERPKKGKRTKPHVKVRVDGDQLAIWVGSNKEAIKLMQASGFTYSPNRHRWIGQRDDPQAAFRKIESLGYDVEVTI